MTELDIDRRLREQRQELRKNLTALCQSVAAGLETVRRNKENDQRAHEQNVARQDEKRKEMK